MQNLRVIDKGGRPRKEFVRQHILDLISKLKYAYPKRVYQEYLKDVKDDSQQVSYMTILRYMEQMAKEDGPPVLVFPSKSSARCMVNSGFRQTSFAS